MIILGITTGLSDSAAALVKDGAIIAAAQQERFSRVKFDAGFPHDAVAACLRYASISITAVDCVAVCLPPDSSLPANRLSELCGVPSAKLVKVSLSQAHAAAAFLPSPFRDAAIIVFDASRPGTPSLIAAGHDSSISPVRQIPFPYSPGLLYSACTAYCGFKAWSGEYKLMGLAPYGSPRFTGLFYDSLISWHPDGYPVLNPDFFDFSAGIPLFTPE